MVTKIVDARVATALRKKIRQFYDRLNRRDGEWCYLALNPELTQSPSSVTLAQYLSSLERFTDAFGKVSIQQIGPIQLHLNEPNRLYNNRDFALVVVDWEDRDGIAYTFRERWVRDGRGRWYTRCTGLVTPEPREEKGLRG